MKTKATDVIIHTAITLTDEQFSEVAKQVRRLDGIVNFSRNTRLPNVIMVAYHSGQTRALTILNKITRLGFNASLVGI